METRSLSPDPDMSGSDISDSEMYDFSGEYSSSDCEPEEYGATEGVTPAKKFTKVPGIVYVGGIPSSFTSRWLRCSLCPYARVGRIHLQPEGTAVVIYLRSLESHCIFRHHTIVIVYTTPWDES